MRFTLLSFLLLFFFVVFNLAARQVGRTNLNSDDLAQATAIGQFDVLGPSQFGDFGTVIVPLANGNIVITDPWYDVVGPAPINNAGAVFLYDGKTFALINFMTGERQNAHLGNRIYALTNGNFVVAGDVWSASHNGLMGGVKFCSGTSGCVGMMTAANSLVGNDPDDYAGAAVTPLANGNYIVASPAWDNGTQQNVGAATFCSGNTGCSGVISEQNSLIGGNAEDQVGGFCDPCPRGVAALPNGSYVVVNTRWNGERGAATFGNGETGVSGVVSASNSLVGSNSGDMVGYGDDNGPGVTALSDSDYVLRSTRWNGNRGAVTLCSGTAGCSGVVGEGNSLIGSTPGSLFGSNPGDRIGTHVVPVGDGNVVIASPTYDRSASAFDAGHATFCSVQCVGPVSSGISLIGENANDKIGLSVRTLPNGNYLIVSPDWNGAHGAVTYGSGKNGIAGAVNENNSLVGPQFSDRVGSHVMVLPNGDYVVSSQQWGNFRGAATLCNGATGRVGEVTEANSLTGTVVGISTGDRVGEASIPLKNGNYVVSSGRWNGRRGAATFCTGLNGCAGVAVSNSNSIVGENPNDEVSISAQRVVALTNGNYVVISTRWNDDRGAVTWGDGTSGTSGIVSAANSLVGSTPDRPVGDPGVVALVNGNYTVNTSSWNNGPITGAGAVTFGDGVAGTTGPITPQNSLVGSSEGDNVGWDNTATEAGGGIYALQNGGYIVRSRNFDSGNVTNAGAITFAKVGGVTGPVTVENSFIGDSPQPPSARFFYRHDIVNNQVIIGRPDRNRVTIVKLAAVGISGRVLTPTGLGLRNALVTLTDSGGVRRTSTTSSFGLYSFSDLRPGESYTVGINSKRYRFAPRTLVMSTDLTNIDFVGLE